MIAITLYSTKLGRYTIIHATGFLARLHAATAHVAVTPVQSGTQNILTAAATGAQLAIMHRLISAPVSEQHPVVTIDTLDMANVKIPDFKLEHALSTWSTSGGRLAA